MKHSGFVLFVSGALFFAPLFASAQTGPAPTCRLTANTGVVQKGGTVNLTWSSTNALSGTLTSVGSIGPSGTQGVIPTRTTEYVAQFTGPGGTARCAVVVIVTTPEGGTTQPLQTSEPVESTGTPFPTQQETAQQSEGLVPCTGLNCQACHLAQLVQNIIKFAIALAVPLAAILIAIAGAMYFTSSVSHKKEKAKAILSRALIGFVIALTAWLVVNTLLNLLFKPTFKQGSTWFTIQCVDQNIRLGTTAQNTSTIGGLISKVFDPLPSSTSQLPTGPSTFVSGAFENTVAECPAGSTFLGGLCYPDGGGAAQIPTYTFTNPSGASLAGLQQYSALFNTYCSQSSLSDCTAIAPAIAAVESGGRANAISPAGCVGLMQVCPGTARTLDPSLAGFSNAQITQRLTDPDYNVRLGIQYLAQLERGATSFDNFIASYNGGPGALLPSRDCGPTVTRWACPINPGGYVETQNYVKKVKATLGRQ